MRILNYGILVLVRPLQSGILIMTSLQMMDPTLHVPFLFTVLHVAEAAPPSTWMDHPDVSAPRL